MMIGYMPAGVFAPTETLRSKPAPDIILVVLSERVIPAAGVKGSDRAIGSDAPVTAVRRDTVLEVPLIVVRADELEIRRKSSGLALGESAKIHPCFAFVQRWGTVIP
jgi:hypothetical protein